MLVIQKRKILANTMNNSYPRSSSGDRHRSKASKSLIERYSLKNISLIYKYNLSFDTQFTYSFIIFNVTARILKVKIKE